MHIYRFVDGKYYVTKTVGQQSEFLECLVKGKLNLYVKHISFDPVFYVEKDSMPLSEISYEEGTKMVNDKRVYYQSNRHFGILAYYTQDAPQLKSDLTKINKPQYDNMIKLARDYHNSVCDNESCIVYQKKVKYLSVSLEPIVSINKFIGYDKIKTGYGVNIYLSSPVFSENTLFYTGIHNYTLTDSAANVRITEIPLQIEYLFGARNFQPKIGLGINLISVKRINYLVHTFNFNTGFNYKFNKTLSFTFKLNAEFVPASFSLLEEENPINVFAINAMLGLRIRLF